MNYSVGKNNSIKVRVEDDEELVLYNNKSSDNTKIVSNHTIIRETDEKYGVKDMDCLIDEKILGKGKYRITVIDSNDQEETKDYEYLCEIKEDYDYSIPEVVVGTDGKIYFNSKYQNFIKDGDCLIFGTRKDNQYNRLSIFPTSYTGYTGSSSSGLKLTPQDINNLSLLLMKLTSLYDKDIDNNIKIVNKYTIWGDNLINVRNSGCMFSNYIKDINYFYRNYQDINYVDYCNKILDNYYEQKPTYEDEYIEEIVLPVYFNGVKIGRIGSLKINNKIKNLIISDDAQYILGDTYENSQNNIEIINKYTYDVDTLVNISGTMLHKEGHNKYDKVSMIEDDYVVQQLRSNPLYIENIIIRSNNLLIGYKYLYASEHINNIIIDNSEEDKQYSIIFDECCCGYSGSDYFTYQRLNYLEPIETYVQNIQIKNELLNNVDIEVRDRAFCGSHIANFPFQYLKKDIPIGEYSFACCKFTDINMDIEHINSKAFLQNSLLTTVSINNKNNLTNENKSINFYGTFENCTALTNISGLEKVKYLQGYTFKNCSVLDLDFSIHNFEYLGSETFSYSGIHNLNSPTLKQVRDYCFYKSAIETIDAPQLQIDIPLKERLPVSVFEDCESLHSIINLVFESIIPEKTFAYCVKLQNCSVEATKNVTLIGDQAFYEAPVTFVDPEHFPKLETVGELAFYCKSKHPDLLDHEIKFLLPDTLTSFPSKAFSNYYAIELYGPKIIDITGTGALYICGENLKTKISLPILEEISNNGETRNIYIQETVKELYLEKAKIISKNCLTKIDNTARFNENWGYNTSYNETSYYPQEILYAPELINTDNFTFISYTGDVEKKNETPYRTFKETNKKYDKYYKEKDFYLPKFWQYNAGIYGFYSASDVLERLVFGGSYSSSITIRNSEKLTTAELGGWYHGRMLFVNCKALTTINTNNNNCPLIESEDTYITQEHGGIAFEESFGLDIYSSTLIFSHNPQLQEVNFPQERNTICLDIDGYQSHTNSTIICKNYDRDTKLQTHTFNLNCNPMLVRSLTLSHVTQNGEEFNYINNLNIDTLIIRNLNDYETCNININNNNLQRIKFLKNVDFDFNYSYPDNDSYTGTTSSVIPNANINITANENAKILIQEVGTFNINNTTINEIECSEYNKIVANNINNLIINTSLLSRKDYPIGSVIANNINNLIVKISLETREKIKASSIKNITIDYGCYIDLTETNYQDLQNVVNHLYRNNYKEIIDTGEQIKWDINQLINHSFESFNGAVRKYICEEEQTYENFIGEKIYTKTFEWYSGILDLVVTEALSEDFHKYGTTPKLDLHIDYVYNTEDGLFYERISHVYLPKKDYDKCISKGFYCYAKIVDLDFKLVRYDTSNPGIRCIDELN